MDGKNGAEQFAKVQLADYVLRLTLDSGEVWHVPAWVVALDRASYGWP